MNDGQRPTSKLLRPLSATALVALAGYALSTRLSSFSTLWPYRPPALGVFYYLYERNEPTLFLLSALFLLCAGLWLRRSVETSPSPAAAPLPSRTGLLALFVLGVTSAGTILVYRSYFLSMDEYMAHYQALILSNGHLLARVPDSWMPFEEALRPLFAQFNPAFQSWYSAYLPGYAAIRALFAVAGAEVFTNAVLSALTILAVAAAARRIWPGEPDAPFVSALLLATSSQLLVNGMTAYAMPAHLLLSLVWLLLHLHPSRRAALAVPWIGILALTLHQPNIHALFVCPFIVRLVIERRWRRFTYYGGVYLLGTGLSFLWLRIGQLKGGQATIANIFALPGPANLLIQVLQGILLVNWQNPLLFVLLAAGLAAWRGFPPAARDLLGSAVLTIGFFAFFPLDQGHGWGDRYAHSILGNLALLAIPGWAVLRSSAGPHKARRLLGAATAFSLLLAFPVRSFQVSEFVAPFARASAYLETRSADFVLFDPQSVWYGQDLVRNDPFLRNRPLVLSLPALGTSDIPTLAAMGRTVMVTPREMAVLGLRTRRVTMNGR